MDYKLFDNFDCYENNTIEERRNVFNMGLVYDSIVEDELIDNYRIAIGYLPTSYYYGWCPSYKIDEDFNPNLNIDGLNYKDILQLESQYMLSNNVNDFCAVDLIYDVGKYFIVCGGYDDLYIEKEFDTFDEMLNFLPILESMQFVLDFELREKYNFKPQ